MKKLIFLDIDGTLFSHKTFSVPASAIEACREAKENGHLLFLSSGRSPVLTKVFREMDFISGQICQDGAYAEAEGKSSLNIRWKRAMPSTSWILLREQGHA